MNILYLSYDGMTDPLGQSQVLPYLTGLSKKGYTITLLSFEKKEPYQNNSSTIEKITSSAGISWVPLSYTSKPPVLSTLVDIFRMRRACRRLHKKHPFALVHCRSYITALMGLWLKRKYGIKFLFDMRGFWADERVDGKIWSLNNPVFKTVYRYFKKKEKQFLAESSAVVSLTQAGKDIIHSWNIFPQPFITVIPCCADLDFFNPVNVQPERLNSLRNTLQINDSDEVISYLGSIGTWYMLNEMLDFFKELHRQNSHALFLFISGENPEGILKAAADKGIELSRIKIVSAKREEVPEMILLSRISLFFILPVFSKKASSPTKMGEIMGMGIPVICNSNVGDCDRIVIDSGAGILVESFETEAYQKAVMQMPDICNMSADTIRQGALNYFSLADGIEKYDSIYKIVLAPEAE